MWIYLDIADFVPIFLKLGRFVPLTENLSVFLIFYHALEMVGVLIVNDALGFLFEDL